MTHRMMLLAAVSMAAFACGEAPAFAQDAPTPAAAANADSGLGDIVVTAQRRKEKLQDIPVTVSAFTDKVITQLHLNDAISVSKFVPGMISQHNAGLASANAYFLRGLGNTQSTATFDAPVTTYVDDVYIARQNANNYAFFDTERVEVLRGPQGTLFGRNTTGGAVNVIMRKPAPEAGLKMEATAGSYDRYTFKAVADVPLSDKVLTKLSAYEVHDKGYLKNVTTGDTLNGEKNYGIRGDVRLLPIDNLTIDLSAEYSSNRSTYLGLRSVASTTPNRFLFPTAGTAAARPLTKSIFYETAVGMPKGKCGDDNVNLLLATGGGLCNLSENFAVSANVAYDIGSGTLNYIFGYRKLDQGYINQYDANNINKFTGFVLVDNGHFKQWSHELKYNGSLFDDRISFVTGLFYLKETTDDRQTTFTNGVGAFNATQDTHLLPETKTAAFYAQADFKVTDALTFTAGGRYTWERKNLDYIGSTQFPLSLTFSGADVTAAGIPLQQTTRRFTPRLAISYKLDPDILLFASATNGFKSGGWNGTPAAARNAVTFRPEKTWSYEAGVKSEFFNHRLRFNATGYFAETKDLQVASIGVNNFTTPPSTASISFNGGTLQVYGLEIESSLQLTRALSLFANPSYMHGKYSFILPAPSGSTGFRPGARIEPVRVPTFQFNGGILYMQNVSALNGALGGSLAFRHNSSYWVALVNTAKVPQEDYLDAAIKYDADGDAWGVSFEVSNLTKQKTVTANFLSLFPGDPRRFTARVKFKI